MVERFVSILMLTHNAPSYVEKSIVTVRKRTRDVPYELVVLDNASDDPTRELLSQLDDKGLIDKLVLLDRNSLFAEGNNIAAEHASPSATHFLLLNSDIEIRDDGWLDHLVSQHERGITSFGVARDPDRVDGYCMLIDADLYRRLLLDVSHQWWWSVTKIQAQVLNAGFSVKGFWEHKKYLHHFGGRSGSAFRNAKGMNVSREEVYSWFNGKKPLLIGTPPKLRRPSLMRRILKRFVINPIRKLS